MRKAFGILALLLASGGCTETEKLESQKERDSIYLGSEPSESIQRILWDLTDLSNSNDYEKMKSHFSGSLAKSFKGGFFTEMLREKNFAIIDTDILTLTTYLDQGYAVVRLECHQGGMNSVNFGVLFYEKEGSVWKIKNFPFVSTELPEWGGRIPTIDLMK